MIDEETLVRLCVSSFTSDEIKKSKSLLFDSIPTEKIVRKNKGKEERDQADIVNLFKSAEPDVIPIFVARQLEKLPPILFNHLDCTKLLKDILRVQNDIEQIKATYATHNELQQLKTAILKDNSDSLPPSPVHKVNPESNVWILDSGPAGAAHPPDSSSLIESFNSCAEDTLGTESSIHAQYREIGRVSSVQQSVIQKTSIVASSSLCEPVTTAANRNVASYDSVDTANCGARGHGDDDVCIDSGVTTSRSCESEMEFMASHVPRSRRALMSGHSPSTQQLVHNKSSSYALQLGHNTLASKDNSLSKKSNIKKPVMMEAKKQEDGAQTIDDEGWHMVSKRKKPKYRYLGKTGVAYDAACCFKAADIKTPIFITNIHIDTPEHEIIKYIHMKTNESITLQKINTKQKGYTAYKFFVSELKVPIYLDEKIWPKGIIFRRFVSFKDKNMNRASSVNGTSGNHNG